MKTILVVDDCREVHDLLEDTLARKESKILGTESGRGVLVRGRDERPDLVLSR